MKFTPVKFRFEDLHHANSSSDVYLKCSLKLSQQLFYEVVYRKLITEIVLAKGLVKNTLWASLKREIGKDI